MEADGAAPAADAPGERAEAAGPALAAAAAVAAGFVLRLLAARQKVLWFDEFLSANLIRRPWRDLLPAIRVEAHPPLYFAVLKAWCAVFGDGPAGLKSLSIVAGAAAAAVLGDAVRRVRGEAAGIAATLLVALSTVQIDQSSEAKPYAVLALFLAALLWAVVRDRETPGPGSLAVMLLAGAAAASTHFYGSVAAAGIAVAAILAGSRRERGRGTLLLVLVLVLSGVWLVPAFSIPAGAADYIREMWAGTPPGFPLVASTRIALPAWSRIFPSFPVRLLSRPGARELVGAALVVLVLAVGFRQIGKGARARGTRTGFVVTAAFMLWPGFLVLESLLAAVGRPVAIIGRNEVVVELGVGILLAIAVSGWRRPAIPIAALAALGLWTALPQWRGRSGPEPYRWEDALVRGWRATIPPGAHVDVVTLGLARPPFEYYVAEDPRVRLLSFPASQNAHPGWQSHRVDTADTLRLTEEARRLAAELDREIDRGVPIYVADREGVRNRYLLDLLRRDHDLVRVPGGPGWLYRLERAPEIRA